MSASNDGELHLEDATPVDRDPAAKIRAEFFPLMDAYTGARQMRTPIARTNVSVRSSAAPGELTMTGVPPATAIVNPNAMGRRAFCIFKRKLKAKSVPWN